VGLQFWSIACLVIAPIWVTSQESNFSHISIDDGLAHNNVNAIVKDLDGFMWFGTRNGLCRYDGYDFRIFTTGKDPTISVPNNRIETLFVDKNGNVWIGSHVGGLHIYERKTQKIIANPIEGGFDDWSVVSVQSIFEDSRGYYWIGTVNNGVVRVDSTLKNPELFGPNLPDLARQLTGEYCNSFAEDEEGNVWLGMSGLYVNCYKWETDSIEVLQGETESQDLYTYRRSLLYKSGQLWVGMEGNGLLIYNLKTGTRSELALEGKLIRDIAQTANEDVIIAADGDGLYVSLDDGRTFNNYRHSPQIVNSLSTNSIYDVFVDNEDNIWLGSFNGGINLYVPNKAKFKTYLQYPSAFQNAGAQSVLSFDEDSDSTLWVGTDGGGLWHLNTISGEYKTLEGIYPHSDLSSPVITSLIHDSQGQLWIGTFAQGLNRLDLSSGEVEYFKADPHTLIGLQNNNVWDLEEDADQKLWIATLGGGLQVYDLVSGEMGQYLPEDEGSSISGRNVRVLHIDRSNNLWIGTERGGLNMLNAERKEFYGWQNTPDNSTSLRSNFVLCILEDKEGVIWIGTEGGGLHRMLDDKSGFKNYGTKDGLPSDIVTAVRQDDSGRLWISTSRGVASFDMKTETFVRYYKSDGLVTDQFNPNASSRLGTGEIIFGNIRGMNGFQPSGISGHIAFPKVVFTDFRLSNTSVPVGEYGGRVVMDQSLNDVENIILRHDDNTFTISFAALAYSNPLKIQYSYRLVGFKDEWTVVDPLQRSATYTNLDAGDYTFEVKASNSLGEWPVAINEKLIIVQPAFWEAWWFRLGLVLLGFLVVAAYIRFLEIRRQNKHERELVKAEKEILSLKNNQLQTEIAVKNSKLSAALLQSAHKNKILELLGSELKDISHHVKSEGVMNNDLRQLVRKISTEVGSTDYWEQFQLNFDQVHESFIKELLKNNEGLTQNDIRLCSLIRINLTNAEIASIQNISKSSVEKSKYRLKQKLHLSPEKDVHSYLQHLI